MGKGDWTELIAFFDCMYKTTQFLSNFAQFLVPKMIFAKMVFQDIYSFFIFHFTLFLSKTYL
jgi:hypothetical protein